MEVTTPELADPAVAGGEAMEDTAAGVAAAVAVPGPMEVVNVDDWPTSAPGVANGTATLEMPEPISTPPHELPALKVTFYELLVRQLQDDGFLAEAQSLAQQLHVEPNPRVDKDALLEAYGKSLKWAFDDEPRGTWTPRPWVPQARVATLPQVRRGLQFSRWPVSRTRHCWRRGGPLRCGCFIHLRTNRLVALWSSRLMVGTVRQDVQTAA